MEQIITSVADNDLYNFHMGDFLYHRYPGCESQWTYNNRDPRIDLRPIMPAFKEQIEMMADLTLTDKEAEHLLENSYCSEAYLEKLTKTKVFDPSSYSFSDKYFGFKYKGATEFEIFKEVSGMAIISELWFRHLYKDNYDGVIQSGRDFLDSEIDWMLKEAHPALKITEMGGRRRFSKAHQEWALLRLMERIPSIMMGTSNVHLGMKHGIPYKGTMAHLLFMFMQSIYPLHISMKKTLEEWDQHFKGKLNVALTDTLGNDKWDRDFEAHLMEKFLIERHDSGSRRIWAQQRMSSAIDKGFDLKQRGLFFSDGLTFRKANENTINYANVTQVFNGIGTWVSNTMDVPGHTPIPQVCKLTWANGIPTVKLSADLGKYACEDMDLLVWAKKVAQNY